MIKVAIVSPSGVLHTSECDEVVIPTSTGHIGVRTGHRPLVTMLTKGEVRIKHGSKEERFSVGDGFAEILPTSVSIISRRIEKDR